MTKTLESIQILLAGSTYLYRLFQNIFGDTPNKAQLEILTSDTTKEAFEIFGWEISPVLLKGKYRQTIFAGDAEEEIIDQLTSEYTRLLIGPGKLPAPPWESVYRSKESLLFQECTIEVRQCFLKYNFIPAEYPHVADDHLALELDFMANLNSMAERFYAEGNSGQLNRLLDDQKEFLLKHLLVWVPEFTERIQLSTTSYLYPDMAILLKEFLEKQVGMIQEIKDKL